MKILMISARSDIGGGPKHMVDLIRGLQQINPEIEIFTASPMDPPHFEDFIGVSKAHFRLKSRSWSLKRTLGLLSFVRRHQIQIIHSHGRGAGVYSRILAAFGHQCVHTFHGLHPESSFAGSIKWKIEQTLSYLGQKHIFVSTSEQAIALDNQLGRKNDSSFVVIDNGIDPSSFTGKAQKLTPTLTLGTQARLAHIKGIDLLIKYFSHFSRTYPEVPIKVLVAGDGENADEFIALAKKLCPETIEFCGEEKNPQEFLKRLNVYISFSRGEGMPLSVLEAMASELPCLLSRVRGHTSLASAGVKLFSSENYQELDKLLLDFHHEKLSMEQMGQSNREQIKLRYSHEQMAKKVYEIYLDLTSS
jgi:glycosyltransferase involved in cell wall biosynthesis